MRIGIIGGGDLGGALAEWWGQAGHEVLVGAPDADDWWGNVSAHEAAEFGEAVLFAPDWAHAHAMVDATAAALTGKTVLDATNPVVEMPDHHFERALPEGASGMAALAEWAPGANWVKAFNTCSPAVLKRRRGRDPLLTEYICTDSRSARVTATRLIQDVGFAPVFAGSAGTAALTESGGPLRMREVDVADATAILAQAMGTAG
jgi:predicted dinucleotide-binding enzyme